MLVPSLGRQCPRPEAFLWPFRCVSTRILTAQRGQAGDDDDGVARRQLRLSLDRAVYAAGAARGRARASSFAILMLALAALPLLQRTPNQ
jgi:hypothetical protein